jgi:hypothetical protein
VTQNPTGGVATLILLTGGALAALWGLLFVALNILASTDAGAGHGGGEDGRFIGHFGGLGPGGGAAQPYPYVGGAWLEAADRAGRLAMLERLLTVGSWKGGG